MHCCKVGLDDTLHAQQGEHALVLLVGKHLATLRQSACVDAVGGLPTVAPTGRVFKITFLGEIQKAHILHHLYYNYLTLFESK